MEVAKGKCATDGCQRRSNSLSAGHLLWEYVCRAAACCSFLSFFFRCMDAIVCAGVFVCLFVPSIGRLFVDAFVS